MNAGAYSAQEMLHAWSRAGLAIKNPSTGKISLLSEIGDQVHVSPSDLEAALCGQVYASFQLWFTHSEDLYCRVRRVNGDLVVEEYGLDGLDAAQVATVRDAIDRRYAKLDRSADFLAFLEDYTDIVWETTDLDHLVRSHLAEGSRGTRLRQVWPAA
jgi:hypothetical protein